MSAAYPVCRLPFVRRAAIHEAAHMAAALAQRVRCDGAYVREEEGATVLGHARPVSLLCRATICAAGPAAEIVAELVRRHRRIDWSWVEGELYSQGPWEWSASDAAPFMLDSGRMCGPAYRKAVRILARDWRWVTRIAHVLVHKGLIDSYEARALRPRGGAAGAHHA